MSTNVDTIRDLAEQEYKWGFVTEIDEDRVPKGLSEETIRLISAKKASRNSCSRGTGHRWNVPRVNRSGPMSPTVQLTIRTLRITRRPSRSCLSTAWRAWTLHFCAHMKNSAF